MIGIAVGHDGPELVVHELRVGLLLPSLEDLVIQELLRVFVLGGYVQNELRIYHDGSQNEDPRIFLNEVYVRWQDEGFLPVFLLELEKLREVGLFN